MAEGVNVRFLEGATEVDGHRLKHKTTEVTYGRGGKVVKLKMQLRDKDGVMRALVTCPSSNPKAARLVMVSGIMARLDEDGRIKVAQTLAQRRMGN